VDAKQTAQPKEGKPRDPRLTRRAVRVQMAGVGLEFAASVLGGLALGYAVDDWLGTEPAFLLLGVFGGLIGSVSRLVMLSRRFERLRRAEEEDAKRARDAGRRRDEPGV
jgi:F0F1-type ATP synthase assembly protein I